MTAYTVINGTEAQITAVAGTTVDKLTYKDAITMTAAEVAACIALGKGIAVIQDETGDAGATQLKRVVAIASLYVST